jgi:putative ABC transport system permease protein
MLGVFLTFISWLMVKVTEPRWMPPMITRSVPLEIHLVAKYMLLSTLFLVIFSIGAASLPARRAAYQSIVDALGHV